MNAFREGGFKPRSFGPREMHKAVCSECGKECEVPFKPTEGKPVYCKDCYASKRKY
jgi:CxxC-x17-CxxC domain-containing protein